jgi:hypothetical protein
MYYPLFLKKKKTPGVSVTFPHSPPGADEAGIHPVLSSNADS